MLHSNRHQAVKRSCFRPSKVVHFEPLHFDHRWYTLTDRRQGSMGTPPATFDRSIVVPGLVDMAQPAFDEVGIKSNRREAFWYRRTFRADGPIPAIALLKVHKAMFGSRVLLNGKELGERRASFTPGYFDVKGILRQGENEIIVRVGAYPTDGTKSIGWDLEKRRYLPGIFDSIELILTGTPHIERVQAVPDLDKQAVTVHAWLTGTARFTVREARSRRFWGTECTNKSSGYQISEFRVFAD